MLARLMCQGFHPHVRSRRRPPPGQRSCLTTACSHKMVCMQSALPCLLMSAPRNNADGEAGQSVLELKGGTDADMAPPVSYIQQVLVPMLKRLLGVDIDLELKRRGFFPKVPLTACQSINSGAGALQPAVQAGVAGLEQAGWRSAHTAEGQGSACPAQPRTHSRAVHVSGMPCLHLPLAAVSTQLDACADIRCPAYICRVADM